MLAHMAIRCPCENVIDFFIYRGYSTQQIEDMEVFSFECNEKIPKINIACADTKPRRFGKTKKETFSASRKAVTSQRTPHRGSSKLSFKMERVFESKAPLN
jgi:hypothetical protein